MAITNYTTLQAAIGNWLARADLTAEIPDFIAMAESEMDQKLRCQYNESSASTAISSGVIAVPTGYMAMKACYIDKAEPVYLEPKTLSFILQEYPSNNSGEPRFFARRTTDFVFGPYPDSNYTIQQYFYKKLDIATDTTNSVLTNARDVYLYGSLYHAAIFTGEGEKEQRWGNKFWATMNALNEGEIRNSVSGGPIAAAVG